MRIDDAKLLAALPEFQVELQRHVSLADLTSLGIGGTTDLLRIAHHESIPQLLDLLDIQNIPHKFLGGGSNLLVIDGELPFVIMQLAQPDPAVTIEGNVATVDAAADLGRTVTFCAKNNLGGMEGLIGVYGGWRATYERRCLRHADRFLRSRSKGLSRCRTTHRNPQGRSNFVRIPAHIICTR
jgi:hypothetical protein